MARCDTCRGKFKVKYFLQKTCSNECEKQYREKNPPKHINKVSERRQIELDQYHEHVRPDYLKNNPFCLRCEQMGHKKVKATEIHHKNGREGERLNDIRFFQSTCSDCHIYIHAHPGESRFKGWLI